MRKRHYLLLLALGCTLSAACRTPKTPSTPPPEAPIEPTAATGGEQTLARW